MPIDGKTNGMIIYHIREFTRGETISRRQRRDQ